MLPQDVAVEKQAFKDKSYINPHLVSQYHQEIGGYKAELYSLPGEKQGSKPHRRNLTQ